MQIDHAELARACCDISRTAGDAIMRIYQSDFAITHNAAGTNDRTCTPTAKGGCPDSGAW